MTKVRVFADTNVILEAFRTRTWTAITKHYNVETVEKCVEETLSGNPDSVGHIAVSPEEFLAGLSHRHGVTSSDIAKLVLGKPSCQILDDGEKHLLAWIACSGLQPSAAVCVTTADKAALVALKDIGWLDRAVSLEELTRVAGVARRNLASLKTQYQESWLSQQKMKTHLGIQ